MEESSPNLEFILGRPLFSPPVSPLIAEDPVLPGEQDIPSDSLYLQQYVDKEILKARLRKALQTRDQISLAELIEEYPLEQGLSELIAYLSIAAEQGKTVIEDLRRQVLHWSNLSGEARQATLPLVLFIR